MLTNPTNNTMDFLQNQMKHAEVNPNSKPKGRLTEKTGNFTMSITVKNRSTPVTIPIQIQLFESLQFPDGAFIVVSSRQHNAAVPAKAHCAVSLRHTRLETLPNGRSIRFFGGKSGETETSTISAESSEQAAEWFPLLRRYSNQMPEVRGEMRACSAASGKFTPVRQRSLLTSLDRHPSMDTVVESSEDD